MNNDAQKTTDGALQAMEALTQELSGIREKLFQVNGAMALFSMVDLVPASGTDHRGIVVDDAVVQNAMTGIAKSLDSLAASICNAEDMAAQALQAVKAG
jgi:hypothetical protein